MGQVRFHQESTERQYALKDKAVSLGWCQSNIQILDRDLGKSGAQITGREDFKTLVTDISMGQVGALFILEASRLARSSLEWQRLIELCTLTGTLIVDEDGCYNPGDFNDGLLLGIKGTIAQAELHFLRARLQGGKNNKAQKGELRFPLPVGFCYNENSIVMDPDKEVQGAVQLVFSTFTKNGSAYSVVREFMQQGLLFPKRSYGGAWNGKLIWDKLTHSRVCGILKNPSYAGVYVYGRYRGNKIISSDGEVRSTTRCVPMKDWMVKIKDHHDAYITWEEFLKNKKTLENNRTNGELTLLSGPAREGLALLQGLLICATCGRKLTVRYKGNGGIYPTYICSWKKRDGLSSKECIIIKSELIDNAISNRILDVIKPNQIEMAIEAVKELEARDQAVSGQWKMRLERAEYDAQLSEKRYSEVDPSNRLVADTLEKRWNNSLVRLEELKQQFQNFQKKELKVATPEQKAKVLDLAKNFPHIWNASTTSAKDKKRMLRLLIKDITVKRIVDQKQLILHIRWQGGACEELHITIPPSRAEQIKYPVKLIENIKGLSKNYTDNQIVEIFKKEGRKSATGKHFTISMIKWIRYKHRIKAPNLKKPEELTVKQVSEKFKVSTDVVYYWIRKKIITARRINMGSPYWVTINSEKKKELNLWVKNSSKIEK